MKKEELQKGYKAALAKIEDLEKSVGENVATPEQTKSMESLLAEAKSIRTQLDQATASEELKNFAARPEKSVVAQANFDTQALPGEGEAPGISMDKDWNLYPTDGMSAAKMEAIKSGAYKDLFNARLRAKGLFGEEWKSHVDFRRFADRIPEAYKGDAMKVLNEGSDVGGGYWLPPDYRPDLVKKMAAMAVIRPNASVYTTASDHITFPAVTYTTDDLYTSGVRFSWRGSAPFSAISEATNPVAGQINIPVHLATAAIMLTREQLEDNSFDLLGYITSIGAESFALGMENAYTNGTGAGQPRGFLQHPSVGSTWGSTGVTVGGIAYAGCAIQSSGAAPALDWGGGTSTHGLIGMEGTLPPQYEANAKWYASKRTYSGVRAINAGTATMPQWGLGEAWPNYANGYQAALLGYKIEKDQFIASTGIVTQVPCMTFGDMHGYYIIDRVGMSVEVFREVLGLQDQVVVYMRQRTGGDLVHYWRLRHLVPV